MPLLFALAALQSAASPTPAAVTDWRAVARADVEAGYALMRDNHPGWVDGENPAFREQLDKARAEGLKAAEAATDPKGYGEALSAFSTVLADGHAGLLANSSSERKSQWPGFLTAWRGNRLLVTEGEASPGFGPGGEIIGCDGTPIAELIVRRLQPRGARLGEAGRWWSEGGKVLVNSAGTPLASCTVSLAGREVEAPLAWRDVPEDFFKRYLTASNGGYTDIGLVEPRPGLFVVGMPTFANGPEAARLYGALVDDIAKRHSALASARAIVLDLRFNQGGSSAWSRKVAGALWGDKAVSTRVDAYFHPVEVWWRNSPGNIAYLDELAGKLRESGQGNTADQIAALAKRMTAAQAAGQAMTVEEAADSSPAPAPASLALDRPTYVIVPGQCSSACLDAVDLFRLFPNVRLVGAPTSADSQYMEIRTETLPSGKGQAVIPLKIWTHRPRKGGQVYWPDIPMKQLDWTTPAFLDAIEADLSKRGGTR